MKNIYCVYAHEKSSNGQIFYIGKGLIGRSRTHAGRSIRWRRTVEKHGLNVRIVKSDMPEPCAFSLEMAMISAIGRDNLCNMTDGGEGTSGRKPSMAQRMKCSKSNKGVKPDPRSIELARIKNSKPIGTKCGLIFSSATSAAKWIDPEDYRRKKVGICAAAQGRNKTAYGYEWGYICDGEPVFKYIQKPQELDNRPHKWKAVKSSNGMEFKAITHAVEWLKRDGFLKANTGGICRAIKVDGKFCGLGWSYVTA